MDNPLTPEKQNAVIEDALHTYPVMPMPRDISADVIARIEILPVPRPFHLTWYDLALGIILSMCLGAIWFSAYNLPPIVMAQMRKESILLYQHIIVNSRWLTPAFSFGLAGFLSTLTIPYLRRELMK
jgi:hypothetical protein